MCPFHMLGQVAKVGVRPVQPHVIFYPNSKRIGGYDTEVTRVLARHFGFQLKFVMVNFGIYSKKNDSYTAGSANDMVRM